MTTSRRAAAGALAPLLAASLVALLPASATALSFSIPAGRTIVDIDFSSGAGLTYDGTTEQLSITTDVDAFRLDDGSNVGIPSGDVQFSVLLMLQGPPTVSSFGLDQFATANFSNGIAFDFTVTDVTGTPELVFGGDFDGDVQLSLTDGPFSFLGDLGGGSQAGAFDITSVNPTLSGQVLPQGDLSAALTNIQPSSLSAVLDGDQQGFEDFTAQPNIDFNLVPEPGSALLLAAAAGGAGLARRRRR